MAKKIQPVDREVGQNIRIFRTAKAMSQTALGEALGVTFQQVQKYEKGTNRVGSSRLFKIAEVLEVPVERLFPKPDSAKVPMTGELVTNLLAAPYALRMLRAFAGLSNDEVRRNLVVLTESIAKSGEG
jgi:transcriptional regulator with XRE-family HTH domain